MCARQVLDSIKFSLKTAVAVPVLAWPGGDVDFVLIFLSSKLEQARMLIAHISKLYQPR